MGNTKGNGGKRARTWHPRRAPRRGSVVAMPAPLTDEEIDRYTTLEGFLDGLYTLDPAGVDEPTPRALVERIQRLAGPRLLARAAFAASRSTGEVLADLLGREALDTAFRATAEGDPAALTDALLASLDRLEREAGAPS